MKQIFRNPLLTVPCLALACLALPGIASATAPVEDAAATGARTSGIGGGLNVPDVPTITDVICVAGCTELRTSSPGGRIEISGRHLDSVNAIGFRSATGRTKVRPDSVAATRLTATVPEDAVSGRVVLLGFGGSRSNLSGVTLDIGPALRPQGRIRVTDASTSPAKAYQYGAKKPTLRFILAGGRSSANVRIDVVNSNGAAVRSFFRKNVPTGSPQTVTWSGRIGGGGQAPDGRYRFLIRDTDGSAASLSKRLRAGTSARRTSPFGFRIYRFIFPVKGSHQFWGGIGDGRGHQGIDIGARCGLPIRAARGGTVYWNDYQAGGAGNYIVINTAGNSGKSHVYMHMPRRSRFGKGARVKTGQVIGYVGSTGRSSGCHLHFEEWSSPGWYQGGTFLNPLSALKRWDRYS
ncbi:MAG: peptidoglycan DD-metalloendopeptidase family protein [Solirubrobacterales bacterium]|nr:peptidoglycan DD-metalloendopeptidase family protein [Solirubrobacterales bacterium]